MGYTRDSLAKFRRSRLLVLTAISLSVFTDTFLYAMIVPIVPYTLKERIGVPDADVLQWTSVFLAVFGLTNVISSPLVGLLADKFRSRRVSFMLGLLVLAFSTILYWVGRSISVLVAARALQGMSATVVWVIGMAIIDDISTSDELGFSLSYVWSANTLGLLSGPALGGVLFQYTGYHSVFVLATGLIFIDMVLRLMMTETSDNVAVTSDADMPSTNDPGEEQSLLDSSQLSKNTDNNIYSSCNSCNNPCKDPKANPSPVSIYGLLLGYPRTATIVVASAVNAGILSSFETILPLYLMQLFHIDAARVGLFFLSLSGSTLVAPLLGTAADRYGTKWMTVLSTLCIGWAILLMGLVDRNNTFNQCFLAVLLFLCGIGRTGQRVGMSTDTGLALRALVDEPGVMSRQLHVENITGQAYGLLSTACGIGVTVGPILSGWIRTQASWTTTSLFLGSLAMSLAVPSVMYTGGPLKNGRSPQQAPA